MTDAWINDIIILLQQEAYSGSNFAAFKKLRNEHGCNDRARMQQLLHHVEKSAVGTLNDMTQVLWYHLKAVPMFEPESIERPPRAQLRTERPRRPRHPRHPRSRSPERRQGRRQGSDRSRSRDRSASSRPAEEPTAADAPVTRQEFRNVQSELAELRDNQRSRVAQAGRALLQGTGAVLSGTIQGTGAVLSGTGNAVAAVLSGTGDAAAALYQGSLQCAASASQAAASQAAKVVVNGSQFADTAANVGGSACSAYVGVKLAEKLMSPDTKNTAGIVAGAGLVIHACRCLAAMQSPTEHQTGGLQH